MGHEVVRLSQVDLLEVVAESSAPVMLSSPFLNKVSDSKTY